MASLTVANASSSKSSLRPGCSDSLFQNECREDPNFLQQVSALERMLRVKARKDEATRGAAATAGASAEIFRLREVHNPDGLDGATLAEVAVGGTSGLLLSSEAGSAVSADESAGGATATAGASAGTVELRKVHRPERLDGAKFAGGRNSGLPTVPELGGAVCAGASMPEARVAVTAGDCAGIISLPSVVESARSSLCHRSSLARSCADGDESCAVVASVSVSAASGVAALLVRRSLTYARAAANACGEVARGYNSWSDTAPNSLRVQNSRRKVSLNSSVGSRSVDRTVDMSPVPVAGTYRRSVDKVHDQRQVPRKRRAERSGRVGEDSLLVMPGRHQSGSLVCPRSREFGC